MGSAAEPDCMATQKKAKRQKPSSQEEDPNKIVWQINKIGLYGDILLTIGNNTGEASEFIYLVYVNNQSSLINRYWMDDSEGV